MSVYYLHFYSYLREDMVPGSVSDEGEVNSAEVSSGDLTYKL